MKMLTYLAGSLLLVFISGCGQSDTSSAEATKKVYYCTAAKTFVAAPAVREFPGLNSQTGQNTLMPAMYCNKCKAWYEVPLPEIMQRNPQGGYCPETKTALVADGPLPEQKN